MAPQNTAPTQPPASTDAIAGWNAIDARLAELIRDPDAAVDPDSVAPSQASLRIATRLAELLQFLGQEVPAALVPDGNGGMIFEWQNGPESRWIEIADNGEMEHVLIRNGQRVFRRTFELNVE